jgi:rod shape-determining protein MreD
MSYKKAALMYAIALVLQLSLLNLLALDAITPNLVLCLALFITYKYNNGILPGLVGIPFALVLDSLGGQYVGVGGLVLFLLCLSVAYFGRDLNRDNLWTLLTIVAVGTVFYYGFYWLIMMILGNPTNIIHVLKFLLIEIPVNLVVTLVASFCYRRKHNHNKSVDNGLVNKKTKSKNKMNIRYTR